MALYCAPAIQVLAAICQVTGPALSCCQGLCQHQPRALRNSLVNDSSLGCRQGNLLSRCIGWQSLCDGLGLVSLQQYTPGTHMCSDTDSVSIQSCNHPQLQPSKVVHDEPATFKHISSLQGWCTSSAPSNCQVGLVKMPASHSGTSAHRCHLDGGCVALLNGAFQLHGCGVSLLSNAVHYNACGVGRLRGACTGHSAGRRIGGVADSWRCWRTCTGQTQQLDCHNAIGMAFQKARQSF